MVLWVSFPQQAQKKQRKYKYYFLSLLLSLGSIILGALFVLLSREAGILSTQTLSIILIVKAIGDFVVAFRNKEIKSSITDTITQLKQQKKDADAATNTPQVDEPTQSDALGEEENEEEIEENEEKPS